MAVQLRFMPYKHRSGTVPPVWRGRRSTVMTIFRDATAINDGTTAIMAVSLRNHGDNGGATAVCADKHRSGTAPPVWRGYNRSCCCRTRSIAHQLVRRYTPFNWGVLLYHFFIRIVTPLAFSDHFVGQDTSGLKPKSEMQTRVTTSTFADWKCWNWRLSWNESYHGKRKEELALYRYPPQPAGAVGFRITYEK